MVSVVCGSAIGQSDVVLVQATRDNTLYESSTGALSNGMGQYFFVGTSSGSTDIFKRRGVLSFDIAAHVPATATIEAVTLTLHVSRVPSGHTGEDLLLHRLEADWGEGVSKALGQEGTGAPSEPGDATWIHRFFSGDFWQEIGGDFVPVSSASTLVDGIGFYSWSSAGMAMDVQSWTIDPTSNFGWILIGNEAVLRTVKRFDSFQNANPGVRPALSVVYTPCFADDHE